MPRWRTPEAQALLADAEDWVGYRGYLDLLGRPGSGKALHGFALGEEVMRARKALELAASGRRVALVSSGDAGIYAMASLVFELLERSDEPAWQRVAIEVSPGISALQAAAARAGAPLGHDFCAISLSDLLTPWPVDRAAPRGRGRRRLRDRALQPGLAPPPRGPCARDRDPVGRARRRARR